MSDGFGEILPYSGFGLVKNEQEGSVVVLPVVHSYGALAAFCSFECRPVK